MRFRRKATMSTTYVNEKKIKKKIKKKIYTIFEFNLICIIELGSVGEMRFTRGKAYLRKKKNLKKKFKKKN